MCFLLDRGFSHPHAVKRHRPHRGALSIVLCFAFLQGTHHHLPLQPVCFCICCHSPLARVPAPWVQEPPLFCLLLYASHRLHSRCSVHVTRVHHGADRVGTIPRYYTYEKTEVQRSLWLTQGTTARR